MTNSTQSDDRHPRGTLSPHRYCTSCGVVKVEGDRKGRKAGYFYSLLARLAEYLDRERLGKKLTKIDQRMICREIRDRDIFTDPYGSLLNVQESVFVDMVLERRGDLNRAAVWDFVHDIAGVEKRRRPRST